MMRRRQNFKTMQKTNQISMTQSSDVELNRNDEDFISQHVGNMSDSADEGVSEPNTVPAPNAGPSLPNSAQKQQQRTRWETMSAEVTPPTTGDQVLGMKTRTNFDQRRE